MWGNSQFFAENVNNKYNGEEFLLQYDRKIEYQFGFINCELRLDIGVTLWTFKDNGPRNFLNSNFVQNQYLIGFNQTFWPAILKEV